MEQNVDPLLICDNSMEQNVDPLLICDNSMEQNVDLTEITCVIIIITYGLTLLLQRYYLSC
jgi:hypothetical protein